ncbi:MAG TPA: V-type ATPase 116kDa subunit family protein [Thermoanaerobaculia bacterium]|nr:V-type ATPase 116kDa subunit family protein [Thermoanaerobaculia bacterium]
MIAKMSKVEIIGPREQLVPVLETITTLGTLQVDPDIQKRMPLGTESRLKALPLDAKTLGERLFYEDLQNKTGRLLSLLPKSEARETSVSAPQALSAVAALVDQRIAVCEEKARRRDALRSELNELARTMVFLSTVESLAPRGAETAGLEAIAVQVKDQAALDHLTRVAGRLLLGAEVRTARSEDGSYIGLLTTEKQLSESLKEALRDNQIPEVALPPFLQGLSLTEKIKAVRSRDQQQSAEVVAIERELQQDAENWRPLYERIHQWLGEQLTLLKITAQAYATDNCFVLFGWMKSGDVAGLQESLAKQYGGTVIVEVREILEHDLDTVPVTLKNPPYLKPFELLVRLLPLPRYTSIDPTPFIGIFFPLFFGMILGDIGYGLLLLLTAVLLIAFTKPKLVQDAGKILAVSSVYAVIFGMLYGEFFGSYRTEILGMRTGWIDRRTSLMPMLYFAIAVGSVHVALGLILGVLSAIKARHRKEAASRAASLLLIVCIAGILASYFAPVGLLIRRPLMIAVLIIIPILLVTGGLLAPFELLRSLGNIISYARIMAVGLASVLLAYVANSLAGAAGSIWVGVTVAVLLHAFNLLLGVFAPTIHALRLHYVEFFGKFLESGGKQYRPVTKAH